MLDINMVSIMQNVDNDPKKKKLIQNGDPHGQLSNYKVINNNENQAGQVYKNANAYI